MPETEPETQEGGEKPEVVSLSKKEHDKLQADLRRATKALKDREEAEAKREADERQAAAKAAGDFDAALKIEREKTTAADRRAAAAERKSEIAEEIAARGFTGSKATMLAKLAGADGSAVDAVDAVVKQFPDMFAAEQDPKSEGEGVRRRPGPGPAVPPQRPGAGLPKDYMTIEEYMATPQRTRVTDPEFQRRARLSEPEWERERGRIKADTFSIG